MIAITHIIPKPLVLVKGLSTPNGACRDPDCETDNISLFCNHGVTLPEISDKGLLVALFGLFGLSLTALSFSLAHDLRQLAFGILGIDVSLVTMAFFWRAPAQRRASIVQLMAMLTVVGVAGFTNPEHAWPGAVGAVLALSLAGLWAVAVDDPDYNLPEILKFVTLGVGAIFLAVSVMSLAWSVPIAIVLALSGTGLLMVFAGSFLREAIVDAFQRKLPTKSFIKTPNGLPVKRIQPRERQRGMLGILVTVGNSVITVVNGTSKAAVTIVNVAIKTFYSIVRWIQLHVWRFVIRVIQIAEATGERIGRWWYMSWKLLRRHIAPALIGVIGFACGGAFLLVACTRHANYISEDAGFSAQAWLQLSMLGLLYAGAIAFFVLAWSSFLTPLRNGLAAMARNVSATAPFGWLLASITILTVVIGLPVLQVIPVVDGLVSSGPYEFGPASVLIVASLVPILIVILRLPGQSGQQASEQSGEEAADSTSLWGWVRQLRGLATEAQVIETALPSVAVAAISAAIVLLAGLDFSDESTSQVLGSTTPQGIYDVRLDDGTTCLIGISGPTSGLSGQTDCTGSPESCFASWKPDSSLAELTCSGGSSIQISPDKGSAWRGEISNAFGATRIDAQRQ